MSYQDQNSHVSSSDTENQHSVYEGLSIRLQPTPLGRRFMAYAVDLGIVYTLIYGLSIAVAVVFVSVASTTAAVGSKDWLKGLLNNNTSAIIIALVIISFLLVLLAINSTYFIYYELKKGTTPGKKMFGLQVVSIDGNRLTLGQCVVRDLMRIIDCTLVLPGLLSVSLTDRRQRLGDLMVGTMVVYSALKERESDFPYVMESDYLLLLDMLKPRDVPIETCNRFLKFAQARYLLKSKQAESSEEEQWRRIASAYVVEGTDRNLDSQTLNLFFAEHCFQTVKKSRQ